MVRSCALLLTLGVYGDIGSDLKFAFLVLSCPISRFALGSEFSQYRDSGMSPSNPMISSVVTWTVIGSTRIYRGRVHNGERDKVV